MGFVVTIRAMGSSPLREALSRLVGEGLVTFEGNKGFRVGGLSREDLADIAYMRTAVETFAIRTAIERGGMEWESGIVSALHTRCSPRVLEMQRRLAEHHNRYRRIFMGENLPRQLLIDEHTNIADATLARDADRAAALLGLHMVVTSDFYARVLAGSEDAIRAEIENSEFV